MIPKRCRFRGKSCRVVQYLGGGKFEILDPHDSLRTVTREQIVFVK